MIRPRALVVSPIFPFPPVSGGRKRGLRLIEAMEASGLEPHILSTELTDAGVEEARRRGWTAERFDEPAYDMRARLRQHLDRQMVAPSPRLAQRLAELGPTSTLIQLEEIEALVYLPVSTRATTTVASMYNVDSRARRPDLGRASVSARVRAEYHGYRMSVVERRAAREASAIACVSAEDRRHFDGIGARRTILAPNGVDESLFALPPTSGVEPSILFFGQVSWPPNFQGLDRFLRDGWPLVRRMVPDARLRVAGPGIDVALTRRGPIEEGVDVLGLVDDIATELERAGAVIVPIWSGGGTRLKVLEAMAAARPLVSTTLGVSGVGFADGRHGLVADDPPVLAAHLVTLLRDRERAHRYGLAAREHARAFEWSLATSELRAFYSALASSG